MKLYVKILLIILALVVFIYFRSGDKLEHLTDISNEAIENIASVYNKDNLIVSNLTVTGNMTTSGNFNMIPRGSIIMWNGNTAPAGWSLCDGSNGTPNLIDKFVLSRGSRQVGATGGTNLLASHVHEAGSLNAQIGINWNGEGNGNYIAYSQSGQSVPKANVSQWLPVGTWSNGATKTDTPSTRVTGSSNDATNRGAIEQMPPYYVLAFIMKL
jgi:hypothetical protein